MSDIDLVMGVAEAKRRFSEIVDRVARGERFIVSRHGKPAVALVAPSEAHQRSRVRPVGLAAVAGALAEWDDLELLPDELYASRRRSRDRKAPELE